MPSSFETLVFEIIAKDKNASAAFDRFRRNVDQTSTSLDRNSKATDKNASTWAQLSKTASGNVIPVLVGTGVALTGIVGAAAAAGAGTVAFGALAVPSVLKVSKALTGPGGLAAAWGTLDNRQRVAAQGVQALGHSYSALATAMEPRTFQVFNTGLALANSLLGPAGKLAAAAGTGVESFVEQFSAHAGLQQFIGFLAREAEPAIELLGTDVTNIAHAVFALVQATGGAGLVELHALTVGLGALTTTISFLSQHAPGLTSVGLAIGGIAFALSKIGALSAVLKLTGLSAITVQMTGFAEATRGATVAERGMLAATTALDAVTPFGWAVLAAAGVATLAATLGHLTSGSDSVTLAIEKQAHAVGFNTSGYYQAAFALGKLNRETGQQAIITGVLTGAQQKLVTEGNAQQAFLTGLENKYHLTRSAAITLAGAAGVTAAEVNKGGQSAKDATAKTDAFANANLAAKRPVIGLAAAVTQLTNAMNKNVTAVLTLQGDDIAWKQALQAATTQLRSNKAGLDSNSKAGLANRAAVLAATNAAVSFADDQLKLHGNLQLASKEIQSQITWLQKHGDKSKFARDEIHALRLEEAKIKAQIGTNITVHGSGQWSVAGPGGRFSSGRPVAAGWRVTGGIPGKDSVPLLAMPGETVLSVAHSAVLAPLLKAIGVPGMAAGGVVGSYGGNVPGLTKWMASENAATIHAIADSVAKSFASSFTAAVSSGSASAGVMRWAPLVLEVLAMLGQPRGDLGVVLSQMTTESGGNPFAINLTDSNAAAGDPSRGLMQTIMSTFLAYAGPFRGRGIYDPLANIYAGVNYAIHRYGPAWTSVLGHGHGYAAGGTITEPIFGVGRSGQAYTFGERGPETVTPGTGHGRSVVINNNFGPGSISQDVDLQLLSQRQSFQIVAAGLGS